MSYYYDDDWGDYAVGYNMPVGRMFPVGYGYPVGAAPRPSHRQGEARPRTGGIITTRPRPTVDTGRRRVHRSDGVVAPDLAPPGRVRMMPVPGSYLDDPEYQAAMDALQRERVLLEHAREQAEVEASLRAVREERQKIAMGGLPNLGGSAGSLVHGSITYGTEIPFSLPNVAAGATVRVTYTVNKWIRFYRFIFADAVTAANFRILQFFSQDTPLREAYSQSNGVPAAVYDPANEKWITPMPWVATNTRFSIQVTNTDAVNPHDFNFLGSGVESTVDPTSFDPATAAEVERFFSTLISA